MHEYVARAERAMGDLAAAVRTQSRAALYEAPWDEGHRDAQLLALEALLAEGRDAPPPAGSKPKGSKSSKKKPAAKARESENRSENGAPGA